MSKFKFKIELHTRSGYPCGSVTGTRSEVVEAGKEQMPWLSDRDIKAMAVKIENKEGREMKTQSKHTPGPWGAVVGQSDNPGTWTVGPQNGGIAVTDQVAEVRGMHNAALIAAAPELLEALVAMESDLVEAMRRHGGLVGSVRQGTLGNAISAIAKATGGEA